MTSDPRDWELPADEPAGLEQQILEALTRQWTRGWMPADILAAVGHQHPARAVRACAALILMEHERSGYGERVSPRWQRQLATLAGDRDATRRLDDLRGLHITLSVLPPLRPLGPKPGEAHAGAVRDVGGGPDSEPGGSPARVDSDLLRRVRGLLAKAESTEFEAEAEAFTEKAQSLIAAHSLQHALASLEREDGVGGGPDAVRLAVERPYHREKFSLLATIAETNRCRAILHSNLGLSTVMGFAIDLDAVELLYTSLLVQATTAMQRHGSRIDAWGRSSTATFRRSFLVGFADRIGERLERATAQAEEAATQQEGGSRLAPVLASRADQVDHAIEAAFPYAKPMRSRARFDSSGFTAGVRAANQADLGRRRPLAS